jgi:hypothetical protein
MLDPRRQLVKGIVERAEEERVDQRYRLSAHAEDIPDDASDAGRGAAVRFHRARVIVALDPERVSVVLVELHHARVAAVDDLPCVDAEDVLFQVDLRALVAAVFAPSLAERLELDIRRVPALLSEEVPDPLHLVEGERSPALVAELDELVIGRRGEVDVHELERDLVANVQLLGRHCRPSLDLDRIVVYDGVREKPPAHLVDLLLNRSPVPFQVYVEDLDGLDVLDAFKTEQLERLQSVLALRVGHPLLQLDPYFCDGHPLVTVWEIE